MAIGFGYFILGLALEVNGLGNNPEIWIAMSIIGIIAAIVSFIYMFYFTYKSYEIQVNNPNTIFDSQSRSKLIFPAVFSVLLTGWIGLIFALVLVIKSSSRRKRMK
jgi:succinate dehydrogenase hydrophobic anchor subunit